MVISTHQVNNVLRVYGDQLRQSRVSSKSKTGNAQSADKITISAEAKRKAIVDKIASDIVDRISHYGPQDSMEKEVLEKFENEFGAHLDIAKKNPTDLKFKVIDENGETINSLTIEDSKFLRYKLEELTKEKIDKNMI